MLLVVASICAGLAIVAFIAAAYVRRWRWTGFTAKNFWDWLELLVIPLALAAVAFTLNYLASGREHRRDDREAKRERSIAAKNRSEDALNGYLDRMSDLLLERRLASRPSGETELVARTLTLTVLRRLDGRQKGQVIRFLSEAGLIDLPSPKVFLHDADLKRVSLRDALLYKSYFGLTDMRRADLRGAVLFTAHFTGTDLRGADFSGAHLDRAEFEGACLTGARFVGTHIERSKFASSHGEDVDFSRAELTRVDLRAARLTDVRFDVKAMRKSQVPAAWSSTGTPMSRAQRDELCSAFDNR
jgi:Pentapeptide repeats (8 copies)